MSKQKTTNLPVTQDDIWLLLQSMICFVEHLDSQKDCPYDVQAISDHFEILGTKLSIARMQLQSGYNDEEI